MTSNTSSINVILLILVIPRLQIEPVALRHAEVMRQAMGDVGVDGALALDDLINPPRRHADVAGQMPDAYSSRS